ncbi:endogenous retrovirus group PABLB member 1 Env polyprotein-like [Carcharodon carcharias]|uniref:endogenous retrovirus group PABLB member 1 Env polyprotein-like n=1 Tax=Carcharodon carcharias TaxID=13397 RepID=UPI001B7E1EA1|nr:endogenous retrovirus group PABLB member 1 Env polyprotein-like [Carcharodon carcharias]XP_041045105.1 endogenous retrovirus group PABLB member 1 Env polyprotein-like [Carcharodon carcharias]
MTGEEVKDLTNFHNWSDNAESNMFKGRFRRSPPANGWNYTNHEIRIKPPQELINATCWCSNLATGTYNLGNSSCENTISTSPGSYDPQNGTFWVCGEKAYPWLPGMAQLSSFFHQDNRSLGKGATTPTWSGCCYLAYLNPYLRHRRDISESERFWMIAIPSYGAARNSREIINLAAALGKLANSTADALLETQKQISATTTEMIALCLTALQNRMALDFLLAEKGGTCAMIGSECCTYVPNVSENITNLGQHVMDKVQEIKKESWGKIE